jgi:hypothetical protein
VFWAGVLKGSRAGHTISLAVWPPWPQLMHVIGQSHRPGVEWPDADLHFSPWSWVRWLSPHLQQHTASLGSGHLGGRCPNLWHLRHCMRGRWGLHFLNVTALPNMARWVRAMVHEMSPSKSRKVKEKLECGPLMRSAGRTHHGRSMKWRSAQSGLRLTSSRRWALE